MFGYVRPRTDRLGEAEMDAYRAAYCGLCRALGKQYGFLARFLVNYDMTFLYLLRAGTRAPAATARCWCPARCCGKKRCALDQESFIPVAACTVILCVQKLRDNIRDEGFLRRLPYRAMDLVFRRAYRKAARRLPAFAALTADQLEVLHSLERGNCPSLDAVADAFARIVAGCAADLEDPALQRPMEQVLYQTGRFLYLADALDDLRADCEADAYNPLRFRFSPHNGALSPADLDYLTQLTDASVNLAGAALALLPLRSHEALLENTLYLGLPSVFAAVKAGRFRARAGLPRRNTENRHSSKTGESTAERRDT